MITLPRLRIIGPLLGLVALAVALPAPGSAAGPDVGCTAGCVNCGLGDWAIVDLGAPNMYWAYEYDCIDVKCPCPCLPNPCNPGGDDALATHGTPAYSAVIKSATDAARSGDVAALTALLASDERFELNEARHAVQAKGCNGTIAVNIQVDATVAQSIVATLGAARS
jgi:hypothetical protein